MLASLTGCELEVDRGPDWLLVKVQSLDLSDMAAPPPLAARLWSIAQQHFVYRLVVDLERVKVLNSHLIGQLILLSKRLQEHEGVLRLCGVSPYNQRVLRKCSLGDRFPAYETRQEAMLGGADPRLPR